MTPLEWVRWLKAFLVSGIRVVWMIAPAKRTISVIRPDLAVQTVGEGETLDGGSDLPGFSYNASGLFRLHGLPAA